MERRAKPSNNVQRYKGRSRGRGTRRRAAAMDERTGAEFQIRGSNMVAKKHIEADM